MLSDRAALAIFGRIIDGYETAPGRGLPIGNLTSQYFANHYLGSLDRFVKETLRCLHYVPYMDDFVIWDDDKNRLKCVRSKCEGFLQERLGLESKSPGAIQPTARGMDFLGMRVFPSQLRLNAKSRRRFERKLREIEALRLGEDLDDSGAQARVTSLVAFTRHARAEVFRRNVMDRIRIVV